MKKLAKRRFNDQQELLEKESKYITSGVSRHQDDDEDGFNQVCTSDILSWKLLEKNVFVTFLYGNEYL